MVREGYKVIMGKEHSGKIPGAGYGARYIDIILFVFHGEPTPFTIGQRWELFR
jgi:hypothetical protein